MTINHKNNDYSEELTKILIKEKWQNIIYLLIDVTHINMFIINKNNRLIVLPEKNKYGGNLLANKIDDFDLNIENPNNIINIFENQGYFLESENKFGLHSFAVPINTIIRNKNHLLGHLLIGPVILNKKLDSAEYKKLAVKNKIKEQILLNEINEIRIVSNIMINSILNLTLEIIKQNIKSILSDLKIHNLEISKQKLDDKISQENKSILSSILELALKLTKAECGSIMLFDKNKTYLQLSVSKGLDKKRLADTRIKAGEGISGLAAEQKSSFFIDSEQKKDNRIKHLLKRPEIKQAFIMPLTIENNVFGVLNLHTKQNNLNLQDNINNLKSIDRLINSVFN